MRLSMYSALAAAVVAASTLAPGRIEAQGSGRSQPTATFSVSDFAKLKWLEGSWAGTAAGAQPIYQTFHVVNDSTIDITYYGDAGFSRESGSGRVYLSSGRIFYTFGPGRWGASQVSGNELFLVPQVNANNTFSWKQESSDTWTSTMRSGVSGRTRVTVYQMQRASHP